MNPIPPVTPIATSSLLIDGYLQLLMVLGVVALMLVFGMMLWTGRGLKRERIRLHCPVRLRPARVLFRLAPDGKRIDVLHCSVFGRQCITCGKACLSP